MPSDRSEVHERISDKPDRGSVTRRRFLQLAGAAGASSALAAAGVSAAQAAPLKRRYRPVRQSATIPFFTTENDPNTEAAANAAISAFEDAHPGVKIEMTIVSTAQRDQKALTGLAVGQDLGVFEIYRPYVVAVIKYLQPLDSLIKSIGHQQFPLGTRTVIGGHDYTFPYAAGPNMLWYRTDKMSAPKTFKDLLAAAKENTGHDFYGTATASGTTGPVGNQFPPYIWAQGGDYFTPGGKCIFNSDRVRTAIHNYIDMLKYSAPGHDNWGTQSLLQVYETGRVAQSTGGGRLGFQIPTTAPQLESKTGVTNGPWGPHPVNLVKISSLAVDKHTANPEMAMEFVKFLLTGTHGVQYANSVPGQLEPVVKSTRAAALAAPPTAYEQKHQAWLKTLADAVANGNGNDLGGPMGAVSSGKLKLYNGAPTPWANQAWGTVNVDVEMLQKITIGGMSVKEGQAWAYDQYKSIAKDWRSKNPSWKPSTT